MNKLEAIANAIQTIKVVNPFPWGLSLVNKAGVVIAVAALDFMPASSIPK